MTAIGPRAKHSAPGQYLGFGIQPIRLCYRLLTQDPSASVSMEHADDIAVHGKDGALLLEQTKSALSQNPLSDWAVDLWKAVANWLDTTSPPRTGEPSVKYVLYVVPQKKIGKFATAIDAAKNVRDVESIVADLEVSLKRKKSLPECFPHLNRFLEASKVEQAHLLVNMRVESSDNDPVDPIRNLLDLTVVKEVLDQCCSFAIGEAKRQAEDLIRAGKPCLIHAGAFQAQFRDFVSRTNLPLLLTYSPMPPPSHLTAVLSQRPVFIRQLELIDVSAQQQLRSVGDYLRSSADKSLWAEAGMFFQRALDDWDDGLLSQHTSICDELAITHPHLSLEELGALVYAKSRQVRLPLNAQEVPNHFIHGSFHDLSDRRQLGWHPDFALMLDEDEAE